MGDETLNDKWHYVHEWSDGHRTLCSGEVLGEGESRAEYDTKPLKKGAITCEWCRKIIKEIKSIPL